MAISFRRVVLADQALLKRWCAEPHVTKWWAEAPDLHESDFLSGRVRGWIAYFQDHPIGFVQDYAVHAWVDHPYRSVDAGAYGIDQFLGDPAYLGRGLGQAMVAATLTRLFSERVSLVVTDPDPENARAIAVYERVGFVSTGRTFETEEGLTLLMEARPKPA